jgi:Uma2 family endonuclease
MDSLSDASHGLLPGHRSRLQLLNQLVRQPLREIARVHNSPLFSFVSIAFRSCTFLVYLSAVPITIELPDLEAQTAFNVARWAEILADQDLAKLPNRIETDRHGHILMTPPPGFMHSDRQSQMFALLLQLLPDGRPFSECPISTADGVKVLDLAWLDRGRPELLERPLVLTRAPEICIEILSPSNTTSEIAEKRALYFDAGAAEVWICNLDGSMSFFSGVDHQQSTSLVCPNFPRVIP